MTHVGVDPNPRVFPATTLFGKAVDTRLTDLVQHFLETAEDTESEKSFPLDSALQERARVYRFAASRITATLNEINGLSYGQAQVG